MKTYCYHCDKDMTDKKGWTGKGWTEYSDEIYCMSCLVQVKKFGSGQMISIYNDDMLKNLSIASINRKVAIIRRFYILRNHLVKKIDDGNLFSL